MGPTALLLGSGPRIHLVCLERHDVIAVACCVHVVCEPVALMTPFGPLLHMQ